MPSIRLCLLLLKAACTSSPEIPRGQARGGNFLTARFSPKIEIHLCPGTTVAPTRGELSPWADTPSDASVTVLGDIRMSPQAFLEIMPLMSVARERCKTSCSARREGLALGIQSSENLVSKQKHLISAIPPVVSLGDLCYWGEPTVSAMRSVLKSSGKGMTEGSCMM